MTVKSLSLLKIFKHSFTMVDFKSQGICPLRFFLCQDPIFFQCSCSTFLPLNSPDYMKILLSFQMQTSFLLQGLGMNLNVTDDFIIPPASLSLFDIVIILVLIPLMDRVIYPLFAKLKIRMTSLRRMGIGMIFAILSVIVAAQIEV